MRRRLVSVILAALLPAAAFCATPVTRYDPYEKTCITPYWFGPNAFPVPYMSDGTVDGDLKLELGFRCVKLKIGAIDFQKELDLIQHIRKHFHILLKYQRDRYIADVYLVETYKLQ